MGRRQTPIARRSIHATGLAGSSRAPTSRISLSSRLTTKPSCIRRRCSRAPFLLRGASPRGRRTAKQRDEQQPRMERRTPCPRASDICCRRGSASWQDNHRQRRCWNWLSELGASAYHFDVLLGERHPLLAAEQLQQDLDPLTRLHVGINRQMTSEWTTQYSDASTTP